MDKSNYQNESKMVFGLEDVELVAAFERGLQFLLQRFTMEQMSEGNVWNNDLQFSVRVVWDVLEFTTQWKQEYFEKRMSN